ncbi:hypothetical protein FXO38_34379 [Capsicum annuum]|uniref:Uncharacterized protein n=1 Tax=Capsicum annuum TaxID=4072 RepID=A0A2G3ACT2_CAPAN|nr:hypothetical protein FXO38_34379 [Capsicum annuum]KAF3617912.1 hypothetical protein FXO37_34444 [Capsicum annuum]PHT92062.1 hypothetical protein T459_07175 [Capsicum annuum]
MGAARAKLCAADAVKNEPATSGIRAQVRVCWSSGLRFVRSSRCDNKTGDLQIMWSDLVVGDLPLMPSFESLHDKWWSSDVSHWLVVAVQDGCDSKTGDLQVMPCVESLPRKWWSGDKSRWVITVVQDVWQIM